MVIIIVMGWVGGRKSGAQVVVFSGGGTEEQITDAGVSSAKTPGLQPHLVAPQQLYTP